MKTSYDRRPRAIADKLPSEIYCHTLTDDSILSPELRAKGFSYPDSFRLDTPWPLFARNNDAMREEAAGDVRRRIESAGWPSRWKIASPGRAMAALASKARARSISRTHSGSITVTSFRRALRFPSPRPKEQAGTGASRPIEECLSLRIERATRRRGQRHSRPQRGHESSAASQAFLTCLSIANSQFTLRIVSRVIDLERRRQSQLFLLRGFDRADRRLH